MTPCALILGVAGQDGSYLADLLVAKGYKVYGLHRHSSHDNLWRIRHLLDKVTLLKGDITDAASLAKLISQTGPQEVYQVADQDNIGWSYEIPRASFEVTALGCLNVLEAVRQHCPQAWVFQPVSATMFGDPQDCPQTEETELAPNSPYACAKAAALHLCRFYRQNYNLRVSCGIMYNHDSERRAKGYLLDELLSKALAVKEGRADKVLVGCPDMLVDIGYAGEYMEAAWAMLQQDAPDDYIIASGQSRSVNELGKMALEVLGVEWWTGQVQVNPDFSRPDRPATLIGNIAKAQKKLSFNPLTSPGQLLARKAFSLKGSASSSLRDSV